MNPQKKAPKEESNVVLRNLVIAFVLCLFVAIFLKVLFF